MIQRFPDSMAANAEFSRLCSSISQKAQRIRSNTEQIRNLLSRLANRADSDELMQKLQTRQHEGMQLATETASMVTRIDSMAKDGDRGKRAQVDRLREELLRVTNDFQSAQRELVKKEKEFLSEARTVHDRPAVNSNAVLIDMGMGNEDLGLGVGSPSSGYDTEASVQARMQEQAELEEIEERERSMKELEKDIVHVNDIFRDLGLLVHEQSEPIESIAYNIETTTVKVAEGTENLRKAVSSKRAVRRKVIILVIIGVVVLAILSLVIYLLAR